MKNSNRGQATVELALSLTVLMFLIFGMVDFGRILSAYMTLEHAGREAARAGSVGAGNTEIKNRALDAASSLDPAKISVQISPDTGRTRGTYLTVTISYPISISTPLLTTIVPNPYIVTSKTVMRME